MFLCRSGCATQTRSVALRSLAKIRSYSKTEDHPSASSESTSSNSPIPIDFRQANRCVQHLLFICFDVMGLTKDENFILKKYMLYIFELFNTDDSTFDNLIL